MNCLELTGRERNHIQQFQNPRFAVQKDTAAAFLEMRAQASKEGFQIHPVSSFRDFKTQLKIWNQKAKGERPLFGSDGKPLEFSKMTASEILYAILGWSALPGASRHHWGSEIDVIDLSKLKEGDQVELLPHEVLQGGSFFPMHQWLDEHAEKFGFFRPYKTDRDGVFPELWHLSYAPISIKALGDLSQNLVSEVIKNNDILLKELLLESLDVIYQRYIINIDLP
ncbi:MAG: M15 family metallopeptidase [Deltaproteobacteria bacterium]|nr:M15 family metallopeptidase [Deltaproteobacteria bacterium]